MKRAQEVAVHQQPENRIFRLNFFTSLLKIRERIGTKPCEIRHR